MPGDLALDVGLDLLGGQVERAPRRSASARRLDRGASEANAAIEADRAKAMADLQSSVGSMAVDLAGKIVGENVADTDATRRVVDRFISGLESSTAAGQA